MQSANDRLLISEEDFSEYEPISGTSAPSDIMPYVREAQMFDLTTVLHKDFIGDIAQNMDQQRYIDLMPYLKPVLCYYAYARYVSMRNFADTPTGIVVKTNEFSQPASEKTIARITTNARATASAYAREMICFIQDNITDYPVYSANCEPGTSAIRTGYSITGVSIR